ncbi:hypothetical protein F6X68_30190 [Micromonospora sp. AMSO12t]|uniref:hypothetical protein n=1 Tax=unclassified Micromonospora TaxID=2617518 RepID=UPI00124B60F1|nr:hypothetical protein [Micromonospora sp. AMSO12t]KAB1128812.1 hypothetical protein F6X68_30190 [Micromonospora sp. AMSO12t]
MAIHDDTLPAIEGYGCATCGVPLTVITTHGERTFHHPDHSPQDHDPHPIPLAQLANSQMMCDFCSAPHPVATFTFGNLDVAMSTDAAGVRMHNLGNSWAACEICARLVEQRDPEGLTRRAHKRARRHHGRVAGARVLRPLHQALFAATPNTPVRRPLSSHDATPPVVGSLSDAPAAPEFRSLRPQMLPKVRNRLVRFWRTSGQGYLLDVVASGERYKVPGHVFPGADLHAPAAFVDARDPEPLRQYTALMANHVENARIFWIDPDFTTLAAHAARDLPDVRIEPVEMPAPDGLLIWHTPVYQPTDLQTGITVPIIAAQWGPVPGGVWITFYTPAEVLAQGRQLTEPDLQGLRERIGWLVPVSTGAGLRFGQPYTPASEQTRLMLCSLIATWILTTQPDAEITDEPADKATRKAYQRTNRPAPLVRLVRLRRKHQPRRDTSGDTPTRVYTRRWWVSGFFREQPWGPGRALRRRTYVRPHVKGPADAPLILSQQVHVLGDPANQNKP